MENSMAVSNLDLIRSESKELGLDFELASKFLSGVFMISDSENTVIGVETFCIPQNIGSMGYKIAKNKQLTYEIWKRSSIPFPEILYVGNPSGIKPEKDFNFPVIIKEKDGSRSRNVFPDIRNNEELEKKVGGLKKDVIMQRMVFGKEYRLLFYKDAILGALEMVKPNIIGDGVSDIESLIIEKNKDLKKKIMIHEKILDNLDKKNYSLKSVLKKGEQINLQENSCLSEGGISRDCTDIVHPDFALIAQRAVSSVGLRLGGLDLICENISKSPDSQKIYFLEVNSMPSLTIHHFPVEGKPRNVTRQILKDLFNL